MAIVIPDATLGATFTNDITGITYTYDGMRWIAEGGVDLHEHDQYVSKSGDTITGFTQINPGEGEKAALYIKSGPAAAGNNLIFKVADKQDETIFYVLDNGKVAVKDDYVPPSDNSLTNKKYVDDEISAIRQPEILASADLEWKVLTNVDSEDPPEGFVYANGDNFTNISTFRFNVKPFNRSSLPFGGASTGSQLTMYSRSGGSTASSGMLLSCYLYLSTSSTPYWKWIGTAEVDRAVLTDKQIRVDLRTSSHRWGTSGMTPSLGYRFNLSSLF